MILECTECHSRFLVPDNAIGAKGRTVRCGKCAHTWFQALPDDVKKALPDLDTLLDEINAQPQPKPLPKGSNLPKIPRTAILKKLPVIGVAIAMVALLLLLAVPSIYGLPRSKGLQLADVGILRQLESDKHVSFRINGKINNATESNARVPKLRITLVDEEGSSLQYWDFPSDGSVIEPGKSIPFATRNLDIRNGRGTRFVVEIGNSLELALRRKPG